MQFPIPAQQDIMLLRERFIKEITHLVPHLENSVATLFAAITRPNWALEWGLPRWVGEAFDLPHHIVRDLVLSNAYMLAFGRILDDVVDEEHYSTIGTAEGALLSAGLQHLWVSQYGMLLAERLQPSRKFWPYFHEYMSQWLGVLRPHLSRMHVFRDYDSVDWRTLAWQGAPLKVCCAAACLLADREEAIPRITDAIDDVMIAVEMLDAVFDWSEDLEAGRHNPFVAFASDLPQTPTHASENRRAVLEEIHFRTAGAPYFKLMYERLGRAADNANNIPCQGLADFAQSLIGESRCCSHALIEHATVRMNAALGNIKAEG